MSLNLPATLSRSNYQLIFDNALAAYQNKTGKDLASDPLLRRLEACNSSDAALALLREKIPGFDQSSSVNDKFTKRLIPMMNVLYTLSSAIAGATSLVSCDKVNATLIGLTL